MPTRPRQHRPPGAPTPQERRRRQDRDRGSAAARGYDRAWRACRKTILAESPLCQDCLDGVGCPPETLTPARQVHHLRKVRDYPERRLDPTNLVPLCEAHHLLRTKAGE